MTNFIAFLILLIPALLCSDPFYLKETLKNANKGDWIVIQQQKNFTALVVTDKTDNTLTIDEIATCAPRLPTPFPGWKVWLQERAPQHTSWIQYCIDLTSGTLSNRYSFTLQKELPQSNEESLFYKLLHLPFQPLTKHHLLLDNRGNSTPWQPKLIANNQVVQTAQFSAWSSYWPNDRSDLAGKELIIYLPLPSTDYPSFFPTFSKIKGTVERVSLRVVDSGIQLHF